jgi:hypothetical protein
MFNKHRNLEQTLFPVMLAAGALLVAGYLVAYEQLSVLKGVGFLTGLFFGFLSFAVGAMRRRMVAPKSWLRAVELLFSPLAFLLLLPFAVSFAGGFFLGGVVSFCITWAATSIVSDPKR